MNHTIPKRTLFRTFTLALLGLLPIACTTVGEPAETAAETKGPRVIRTEQGRASYYCIRSNGGRHTASGERLCEDSLTAAHRTLPMGTEVRVTNLNNGRSVVVRINNRGPFIKGRIIDVTKGAAEELNMIRSGVVPVEVEVLAGESADSETEGRS